MKANIGRYKDRDHYLGVSLGIVDDLTHHVQQILSLSSVQELRDKKEVINLLEMTDFLLKDYDLLAKEREISVVNQLTDQQTYLNPSVLKLILSNLISNAVKHSVQGGYLKIGVKMAGFSLRTPVHLRSKINLNNPLRFLVDKVRELAWDYS